MFTSTSAVKSTFNAVAALFVLGVLMFAPSPVQAESYGSLVGVPIGAHIVIGPGGNPNRIDLTFDTQDGLVWTVRCERSLQNLGLCSNLLMGFYRAEGVFVGSNSILIPGSMEFLPLAQQQGKESLSRVPVLTVRTLSESR